VLFDDTVLGNIRLGRPEATRAEVEAAARAAQCDAFVAALPDGYDTRIGEGGARLSGGERQRLSVARVLLKGAPILLLDEATASLDPENANLIQRAFGALLASGRTRTTVVVAHRLASVAGADQILVLDRGRVVERGTHGQLLAAGGPYRTLWDEQQRARGWRIGTPAAPDA
jgi:ATP-binding cassette subfamily B protein